MPNMKILTVCALAFFIFQVLEAKAFDLSNVHTNQHPAVTSNRVPKNSSSSQRTTVADMRAVCGHSNPPAASRIIGSWDTGVHEFPWMAAIWKDEMVLCGGSLISDQWVLTAAHCAAGTGLYRIWLGANNVQEVEDFRLLVRFSTSDENNIIHPGWDPSTHKDDIALIKLPAPVELSGITPISPVLRKMNVTVISNAASSQVYGDVITADHMCISTEDGHGTCICDIGGPLSHVSEDGTFTQIGVVSFAHPVGCMGGYPAGFSRVSNYIHWISEVTGLSDL